MDGIRVASVTHGYQDERGVRLTVLKNISLTWAKGECLALLGESGSGKSTLARLCTGLEKPSSGQIFLDGEGTTGWTAGRWRKHRLTVQAVFQDAAGTLNPKRSVYQNREEALVNLTELGVSARRSALEALMVQTGLKRELLKTPVRQLSGGEQRRVALARALSVQPAYLVLDEVTSGLDVISADAVLTTLEAYREKFGCSYLLITHDWRQASRLADRMVLLENGVLKRQAIAQK